MSPDEPDVKRENLADTDESPFGDTNEHAGEQDTDRGETYHDPEAGSDDADERDQPPGGEGGEGVPAPDSERLANRTDA